MAESRLPAKLSRPRLFRAIERERLFALLDAQRERPLLWIAGPPGAGKTTLVTTCLARNRVATLWYRVDDGDADAATFFSYLAQAAGALTRKRKLTLPPLTPEYLLDLPGFARRFFRTLFAALPASAALVLDSYENAPGDVLDALLAIAVAEAPPHVRLLVTSRAAPPPALAHLMTKGTLAVIPAEDMRLSVDEARAIADAERGVEVASVEALHALHALCDGWTAGFVVMLDHARRSTAIHSQAPGALRESLFRYFVNEMFGRADAATRALLMRTALMPAFSEAQAAVLYPQADAGLVLQRLYRQHYFIDRSTGATPVYRYHALFRDFLLEQGHTLLTGDERLALLAQAAALLEQGHHAEDAIALLMEACAWRDAARLLCELAPALLGQGRAATLDKGISALPQNVVDEIPWLSYWLGAARLPFAPPVARALLEAAYARAEAGGDLTLALLACSGILETYLVEWNDVHLVDRWGAAFVGILHRMGEFPSAEVEIRALASLTVLFFRGDIHVPLLERAASRGLDLISLTDDPTHRVAAANFAGWILAARGDWPRLRQLVADIDTTLVASEIAPLHLILWPMLKALCLKQTGAFAAAIAAIRQAESLTENHGIRVYDIVLFSHGVDNALSAGDLERAETYVARMRAALNPARALDAANCDCMAALVALARGDPALALQCARDSVQKTLTCGASLLVAECRITLAYALLDLGESAAALEEAGRILAYAVAARQGALEHSGLMIHAEALRRMGAMPEALTALRKSLAMGRENGYVVNFPWAPPRFMQAVLGMALNAGIEVAYVRGLIRKLKVPAPDTDIERWPWPLRVRTLGHFEVLRDGAPIAFPRKAPGKPLALLKLIVAWGGKPAPQGEICDALWPQAEADIALDSLSVTVHRLRRLLGDPESVKLQDGRLNIDTTRCHVDAWAFESLLERADEAARSADTTGMTRLCEDALRLYAGHLLPGESDLPPVLAYREKLRAKFVQRVGRLAAQCEKERRWDAAEALYLRGIEVDDLVEAYYQGLMRCHLAQERRADGITLYQRMKQRIFAVLGVAPSARSEALYKALRGE